MSSKKPRSRPASKFSFAVDREALGVSSAWADVFVPEKPTGDQESVSAKVAQSATVADNATDVHSATDALSASVELSATVAAPKSARSLRCVADGLTPGQFVVYTHMFQRGEGDEERLYSGGYHDLCRATGLSKRGVQNIIAELQEKHVLKLEKPPGHYRTQVSFYRVRSESDVLAGWYAEGYRFVLGKGRILLRDGPHGGTQRDE